VLSHNEAWIIARFAVGVGVVALATLAGWRFKALTDSGAIAALGVGTASVAAGAGWALLLLFFFASSSALSRLALPPGLSNGGAAYGAKGATRDAAQVLANGALFAVAALGHALGGDAPGGATAWSALGVGGLATATADTWSTEVGTRWGGMPRDVVRWTPVLPGASGGITLAGTSAGALGALLTWTVAHAMQFDVPVVAVVAGGLAGALSDSVLGATVQERRWCDHCGSATERRTHSCGAATRVSGGVKGFDNDAVNFASILIGASLTCLLS
jgi:uncharacterized protein (TIGR00297 family)